MKSLEKRAIAGLLVLVLTLLAIPMQGAAAGAEKPAADPDWEQALLTGVSAEGADAQDGNFAKDEFDSGTAAPVQTGDQTPVALFLVLFVIAACLIAAAVVSLKRRHKKKD